LRDRQPFPDNHGGWLHLQMLAAVHDKTGCASQVSGWAGAEVDWSAGWHWQSPDPEGAGVRQRGRTLGI